MTALFTWLFDLISIQLTYWLVACAQGARLFYSFLLSIQLTHYTYLLASNTYLVLDHLNHTCTTVDFGYISYLRTHFLCKLDTEQDITTAGTLISLVTLLDESKPTPQVQRNKK